MGKKQEIKQGIGYGLSAILFILLCNISYGQVRKTEIPSKILKLSNNWKTDSMGLKLLRSPSGYDSLFKFYRLSKADIFTFVSVFGEPDFVSIENEKKWITISYYCKNHYKDGKSVDWILIKIYFDKKNKYNDTSINET